MRLPQVMRIAKREYVESVRKKSFVFGLIATPVLLLMMVVLPLVSGALFDADEARIAVVDPTGEIGPRLAGTDWPSGDGARTRSEFVVYESNAPSPETLDALVAAGEYSGWLRVPEDFEQTGKYEYRSESVTNVALLQALETRLDQLAAEREARRLGLDDAQVERLLAGTSLRTIRLGADGASEADFTQVYLKAVALVMILFFALIPTGHILMRSVIEEKANRVIEVLVSSVSPLELMTGKVLGLGAVGLTMLGVWTVAGTLLSIRFGRALPVAGGELAVFAAFFVPGYFLFAALLGGIGSVCRTERDAQPFLTPISMTMLLPVMIGFAIAQQPDHWLARALTFFPPMTPSLVLFRYAIKPPPFAEMAAAWVLLVAGTVITLIAASRVFRTGILMTGKRPTLPELLRWARASAG